MAYNNETGLYEGYIYKITNCVNNKIYIGQTTRTLNSRWSSHKSEYKRRVNEDKLLFKAFDEIGIQFFKIEQINIFTSDSKSSLKEILNYKEKTYIKILNSLFPNGYNMTPGGDSDGNATIGKKKVAQYDLYGKLLKIYNSGTEANEILGVKSISAACIKKYLCLGYMWRFVNGKPEEKISPYKGVRTKRIIQVDNKGSIVGEFSSIAEASIYTNINNVTIGDCVANRNNRKTAGGYRWYEIPFNQDISNLHFNSFKREFKYPSDYKGIRKINKYTLDNVYIQTYDSQTIAYKNTNIDGSSINKCCRKKQKSAGGYRWYYADDPNQPDPTKIITR